LVGPWVWCSMSDSSSGCDSSDREFVRYQRTKHKEDLDSIQPINARHGSIMDRYDRRDLKRWGLRSPLTNDI
jgi:hypothetical protein